jgi:hypothetical protein
MLWTVKRSKRFKLIESPLLLEDLRISLDSNGGIEDTGYAVGRDLSRERVRRRICPEEIASLARGRGLAERGAIARGLDYRHHIHVRLKTVTKPVSARQYQVIGRTSHTGSGAFYMFVSHNLLVLIFGASFLYSIAAIVLGAVMFWRDVASSAAEPQALQGLWQATKDATHLKYLDGGEGGCGDFDDKSADRRKLFHHMSFMASAYASPRPLSQPFITTCSAAKLLIPCMTFPLSLAPLADSGW